MQEVKNRAHMWRQKPINKGGGNMMLKIINMMLKMENKDKEKNSTSDTLGLTLIQKIKIIPKA